MKGYLVNPERGRVFDREDGWWAECRECTYASGAWAIHYQAHKNLEGHIVREHGSQKPSSEKASE